MCPKCSKKFRRKEIVNLYAPVIAVPNADLEKQVQCLKKENMSLKIERNVLLKEINKQKVISSCKACKRYGMLLNKYNFDFGGHEFKSWNQSLAMAPAWSCCGDKSNSHNVYARLQSQNGMLLVFDICQTSEPMQLIEGLTSHPVHFVDFVVLNDGSGRVFSASSSGPCVWEVGFNYRRPFLIPEMQNRGVCISLACCGSSDIAVATFRPKFGLLDDIIWVDY
ncbi:hypothetical protein ZIOFF_073712 [Zingiber officinale]|uniref:Uncharacterized protein n=1 Tax=Zingiber officinale TaxID=94328 RepID=A0A8J5C7J4_ZINOF|nr:hypothetical protein ZIOFF_073712 [Zingiber officinale]